MFCGVCTCVYAKSLVAKHAQVELVPIVALIAKMAISVNWFGILWSPLSISVMQSCRYKVWERDVSPRYCSPRISNAELHAWGREEGGMCPLNTVTPVSVIQSCREGVGEGCAPSILCPPYQ